MILEEKSAAVTLGLNETFGVTEFEDIRDLTERPGSEISSIVAPAGP